MRQRLLLALLLTTWPRASHAEEPSDVTIRGERARPATLTLPVERAAEGAGTQGDPVKALQSLPGVGHSSAAEGEPILWGGTPGESRIFVDGVELPLLFHGSGVRSVIPAVALSSMTSTPGAFGAEHGRALGGLVELTTREPDPERVRLRAGLDLLDASALVSAPLGRWGGGVEVGARYGYVDRWLSPRIDPALRGLYRVPAYWDAQAQLSLRLGVNRSLRWVALTSSDRAQSELFGDDPETRQAWSRNNNFGRFFAQYQDAAPGERTRITPFVGWDSADQAQRFGARGAELDVSALRYGLRARHDEQVASSVDVSFGVDVSGSRGNVTHSGAFDVPSREGSPYPFGTPPGTGDASEHYSAQVLGVGVYAEARFRLGSSVSVTPGFRFEPTLLEASQQRPPSGELPDTGVSRISAALEPRLAAEALLSRSVRLFLAAGMYHQPPALTDLGARFGNPGLPLASGDQVALGESAALFRRTRVEIVAFAKRLEQLPTANLDAQPELSQSLLGSGAGRVVGAQWFLRQAEISGFSGWLSATLSRSERRDADGSWRVSDYDSPLVVAVAATQRAGAWRFGARARFASGPPRTAVVGAYFDLAAQRYQPLLGPHNGTRLRDFFQLDLRIDRRFQLDERTALELYLDALNVTLRQNQEELAYSSDFRRVGSVTGLPPLAILGVTPER